MDYSMLVNESHPLPEDYIPEDLISLYSLKNRSFLMRPVPYLLNREAAKALNDMCLAAKKERGFEIVTDHAYRTRKDQELVYRTDVSGCTAKPGCSEHETGLCVDLFCTDQSRAIEFHDYLTENCHRFGYIYRYPRGWEHITRIPESPRHYRYVGNETARKIKESDTVLEGYHDSSLKQRTPFSIPYIFMSIFGPKMKGHWQRWPDINLDELRQINPETVGWIHMDGTPIDYPVMYHREYPEYYLAHNFSDEPSAHGSILMYESPGPGICLLSGHHMKDCSMFMKLIEISDQMSFDVHPELSLLLEKTMYQVSWFAAYREKTERNISLPEDGSTAAKAKWLHRLKEESLLSSDVNPTSGDEILICSTCARKQKGIFVLYGLMEKQNAGGV